MNPDDTMAVANGWIAALNSVTDAIAFAACFLPTGWLRDLLCFSWEFRTLAGPAKIAEFLAAKSADGKTRFETARLSHFQIETTSTIGPPANFSVPGNPNAQGVAAVFTFSINSPPARGRGYVRLLRDAEGEWKAFTVLTNFEDLLGHEEPTGRLTGFSDTTWEEDHAKKIADIEADPTVLIIGGGQAGLMCAARLGRMGIRSLVIEKTKRVGDVWRRRKNFPKFIPKEKVADFLEAYAIGQEIHVWLAATVLPTPTYDIATDRWTVNVDREGDIVTLAPKHIVMATGNGPTKVPMWRGMDSFSGHLYHSDQHHGAAPFKGKRVIIVGACNSGADMCQDFVAKGAAEVTMVQRGATCVMSSGTADKVIFSVAFSERQTIEDADFVNHSMPHALDLQLAAGGGTQRLKALDQKLHDDLTKAGMKLTWELTPGGGEVGLIGFFLDRTSSGSMLDIGCGQLIIDGKVKIKQGVDVKEVVPDGLVFQDGSKIVADVIVLATGHQPIISNAVAIFGEGIKDKVGSRIWGLDEEGELRGCYRPTGQPGLWFTPGGFQHSRFFSKHLAIQILAQELGWNSV
ncbi:FAD/NAD(P)-binding domain-containing protein [Mycena rebaudengoi]|nr:FAD/NAD(P)-binding domain-containing protein [Mycena rebaudengoi]